MKFYGEQTRDHVLAYAVELTGKVGGKIRGTLYELDYHCLLYTSDAADD